MRVPKIKKTYLVAVAALAVGAMICLPRFASAAVTGQCSNCHTMHNSQNGTPPLLPNGQPNTGAHGYLLKGGCLGCHSAPVVSILSNGAPVVYRITTEPAKDSTSGAPVSGSSSSYLAGGDFYWMMNTDDAYGHNVYEIKPGQDSNINSYTPPGWSNNTAFAAADNTQVANAAVSWTQQLTCAGTYGCHGTHTSAGINGGHHGTGTIDGSTVARSYRFLIGIKGTEDSDWEQTFSSSDHNGYFGEVRTSGAVALKSTISFLCAECHGNFHSNNDGAGISGTSFASPWIRHPVDIDLSAKGTEYHSYVTYDPVVPVANTTGAVVNTTVQTSDNGLVTCVSCHRAHGSPFPDLLRWDYSKMLAGAATASYKGTGCFKCHSSKDDGINGY